MPNWQEYLAGTNPTNALSALQFLNPGLCLRRRAKHQFELADGAGQDVRPAIQPDAGGKQLDACQHQSG